MIAVSCGRPRTLGALPDVPLQQRAPAAPAFLPAALALARREAVRFLRQRNRVIGAVATPLVFWLLLGLGLDRAAPIAAEPSATVPGMNQPTEGASALSLIGGEASSEVGYFAFFFPGILLLMVLFTAIFTTITVIEDRREGFLQAVLVSPASRTSIIVGKVIGGTLITLVQAVLMLALGALLVGGPGLGGLLLTVGIVAVLSVTLTALGLCLAWPMDSTAGFHALMNLLLMPMWFLSGAVFPAATAGLMKPLIYLNPLSYGFDLLAAAWNPALNSVGLGLPAAVSLLILAAFTGALLVIATRLAHRPAR